MALIPSTRYPAQIDTGQPGYPQGKARNAGAFADGTGTPLEKDWVNDVFGMQQALLADASIVPSGSPDAVGASQYLAAVQSIAARAAATAATLQARRDFLYAWGVVALDDAPPTTAGIAAVWDPLSMRLLSCKGGSNGTHILGDDMRGDTAGDAGTVTTVRDAAYDPVAGKVLVVGTGGGFAAFSTNFGVSWTTSTTPITGRDRVTWDAVNGLFIASLYFDGNINTSPTGVTFTARALSGGTCNGGHATRSDGVSIACRNTGTATVFDRSTNGTTWTSTGQTIPDVANASDRGCVACLGSSFLQIQAYSAGASLRVHTSSDGITWSLLSTITLPLGTVAAFGGPRIIADPSSGALFAFVSIPGAAAAMYAYLSTDAGVTWIGPARYLASAFTGFQAAGGRLVINSSADVRMTTNRMLST
jgi:hypothetical protein